MATTTLFVKVYSARLLDDMMLQSHVLAISKHAVPPCTDGVHDTLFGHTENLNDMTHPNPTDDGEPVIHPQQAFYRPSLHVHHLDKERLQSVPLHLTLPTRVIAICDKLPPPRRSPSLSSDGTKSEEHRRAS